MAFKPCRECGEPSSMETTSCPRCGTPRPAMESPTGTGFEWKSSRMVWGYPLVHVAWGRDASGRRRVAKGVVAVGQFGIGVITVAQVGFGLLFGLGQVMVGMTGLAQLAVTARFGAGQFAAGYTAIGQFAVGHYALCQAGIAKYLWSTTSRNPDAVQYFHQLRNDFISFF